MYQNILKKLKLKEVYCLKKFNYLKNKEKIIIKQQKKIIKMIMNSHPEKMIVNFKNNIQNKINKFKII